MAEKDENEEIHESLASIRVNISEEIDRLRKLLDQDVCCADEVVLRARISGLEWALSLTCLEHVKFD